MKGKAMDVFIDQFNRANFPIGTSILIAANGLYCVAIPGTYIMEYDEDPLTAIHLAQAKLALLRSKKYEDQHNLCTSN